MTDKILCGAALVYEGNGTVEQSQCELFYTYTPQETDNMLITALHNIKAGPKVPGGVWLEPDGAGAMGL